MTSTSLGNAAVAPLEAAAAAEVFDFDLVFDFALDVVVDDELFAVDDADDAG